MQTSDKGYLLAGASFSGISGDKTQTSQGSWDYWIVRIDSLGNKVWDKNFDLIKISKQFNFMGAHIEFCAGMAIKDDSMLITFGFQDNAAYIVKSPMSVIEEYLHD